MVLDFVFPEGLEAEGAGPGCFLGSSGVSGGAKGMVNNMFFLSRDIMMGINYAFTTN